METFSATETTIILAMVASYILFTSWLTYRLRSRTNAQFMTASRALPATVVGILLMSEFVGAKSTVGTAQEAFTSGFGSARPDVSMMMSGSYSCADCTVRVNTPSRRRSRRNMAGPPC